MSTPSWLADGIRQGSRSLHLKEVAPGGHRGREWSPELLNVVFGKFTAFPKIMVLADALDEALLRRARAEQEVRR
jgi:hypothetical protein